MNKRVFPFIVFLIIFFLFLSYTMDKNKGSYIKLDNKTNEDLKNLTIISNGLKEEIKIDRLEAGGFKEFSLDFRDGPFEASLDLVYLNRDGEEVRENLVAYFEGGEKIQKRFTIRSMDKRGNLEIKEDKYGLID